MRDVVNVYQDIGSDIKETYTSTCNRTSCKYASQSKCPGADQLMLQLRLKRLTRFACFRLFCFVAGKAGPISGRGADGAQPESRETFDPLADGERLEHFHKSHKFSSKLTCFPVLIGYGYKPHIYLLRLSHP